MNVAYTAAETLILLLALPDGGTVQKDNQGKGEILDISHLVQATIVHNSLMHSAPRNSKELKQPRHVSDQRARQLAVTLYRFGAC